MWDTTLFEIKREVHEALCGDDKARAAEVLRNPAANYHFWGFDSLVNSASGVEPHEHVIKTLNRRSGRLAHWLERASRTLGFSDQLGTEDLFALWLYDSLVSLAEAVGARRSLYPEAGPSANKRQSPPAPVDDLLDAIERELGIDLVFPNPYPDELGLRSRRGVVAVRAIQALYQAWRIAQIAGGRREFRVLEIGAGLGRTAYFASCFGISDYTIIDIPLTNAAQGYFLGRTLGADHVSLPREAVTGPLRIVNAGDLSLLEGPFDLVFNADSWTELAPEIAKEYWAFARKFSNRVLSINHEFNANTVRSLYAGDPSVMASRHPYWVRRGYVEEYLTWETAGVAAP